MRKPLHKDIVTPSRAIYTEAHYAILCAVEVSHVSSYKKKHNASLILPKNRARIVELVCKDKLYFVNFQIFSIQFVSDPLFLYHIAEFKYKYCIILLIKE